MLRSGAERRDRLARARLYLVTGAREDRGDLPDFLHAVLAAGVDIVQLREKEAEAGDLLRWSPVFREAADRHGALFIVNDRPDVALVARADGVHLGQDDLPVDAARALIGAEHIIGLSTHSEREFLSAARSADYVCVGPVHETATKPGRPATGLGPVRAAAARKQPGATERPWFAIGGIDGTTLDEVIAAGARRVAVVRAVTEARDPALAVRELRVRIRASLSHRGALHP